VGGVLGELFRDLSALACLHLATENGNRLAGVSESFGDRVEVVDPSGQDKDVGAIAWAAGTSVTIWSSRDSSAMRARYAVDLGHSIRGARIGVSGVAEPGGVGVQDWIWREEVGVRWGSCPAEGLSGVMWCDPSWW
jgi:hypothetical protein